jgi:general secretion pathway protein L
MKSVGIDIGSSSIKIVEAQTSAKGLVISRFTEKPLSPLPGADHEIEVLDFLRTIASQYDADSTRFVIGIRQDRVAVRNKVFPFSDRNKILKSLPFELEEELPFSAENSCFDARMVKFIDASAEVLACAVSKTRVSEAIQKMQDGGLQAQVVTVEGLAFANCWETWNSEPKTETRKANLAAEAKAAAESKSEIASESAESEASNEKTTKRNIEIILHIGHTRTLVTAFESGAMIGVRCVFWGAKNIVDAIARKYEMEYIQALKEVQTKSFILPSKDGATYDQIVFSDTIFEQVKDLSREIKVSILEFESELNAKTLSLGITGGGARVLNLNAALTQTLEVPVNNLQVLSSFNIQGFERTPQVDHVIAPALGLAIEGLRKPRNPAINFLKGEFAPKNIKMEKFWETWKPAIQTLAASFILFAVFAFLREGFSLSLAERTEEVLKTQAKAVAGLPPKQANEAGVNKFVKEQKLKSNSLSELESLTGMNSALDFVKKISLASPSRGSSNLVIQKISVKDDILEVSGKSQNPLDIANFKTALETIALDGKVQSLNLPSGQFSYSARIDRGITKVKK